MGYTNNHDFTPNLERPVPKAGIINNMDKLQQFDIDFITLIGSLTQLENPAIREPRDIPWVSGLSIHYKVYKAGSEDTQNPHHQDEIYVILQGSGQFRYGDKELTTITLKEGDVIYIPAYMPHHFVPAPTGDLHVMILFGPDYGKRNATLKNR